jgi:LPS-assembly protein
MMTLDSSMNLLTRDAQFRRFRAFLALPLAAAFLFHAATAAGSGRSAQSSRPASPAPSKLTIQADTEEMQKDVYHLHGHVRVTYQGMDLTADEASYNSITGEVVAKGHVVFAGPDAHLEANEAHYNVITGRGWFIHAHGTFQPHLRPRPRVLQTSSPFHLQAEKVVRLDESNYILSHGRVTMCEHPARGWTISTRKAHIVVDDKVVSHDAVVRFFHMPVLYLPVMVTSIKPRPRQSGFLLPEIGESSQKGLILGDGFFWAINPSADLLLGLENYSLRGVARGGRFRARPTDGSNITVNYFGVNDQGIGPLRQQRAPGDSLQANGVVKDLGYGFRGVLDVDYISSLAFRLTFTNNFSEAVSSEAHQRGFVTKNFDADSINFDVSRYQDFLSSAQKPGNSVVIQKTPEFSFSGIDQQIGHSPFYFSFDTSAGAFGRSEPGFETPDLSPRLDFHPQLTLRAPAFWGFHITPSADVETTHYGASRKPGEASLDRVLGELSVDVRPPSLEKVFSVPHFGYKFKHVIEPDITYRLVRASDPQDIMDVVRFDNLDTLTETNEIEYSLTNSILVRKDEPDGSSDTPQARDLISWRLSQKYYFDPSFGGVLQPGQTVAYAPTLSLTGFAFTGGRHLSPIVSVLKLSPFANYDTEVRADVDPSGGGVLNAGITSHLHRNRFGLALTDFFINRTVGLPELATSTTPASLGSLPSFNLLRTVVTYGDVSHHGFSGAFGIDYNFSQRISQQVVSQLSYNFSCFAVDFEYRRFDLGPLRRENQFRVAISLANVGTFGDLKPRERLY